VISVLAVALASAILGGACKGGGDDLEDALKAITDDQLAIMVLPQEAYGDAAEDIEVDPDSGFEDSDEAADDTLDPEDTGDDLEEAGFVTGYSLSFEDPTFSALEDGEGILNVSSTVELFEDEQAASSYFAKLLEDNRRFEGEEFEDGTTLEEVEEFEVEGIADDATGLVFHGSFGETDFYATGVIFTVGRLRAGAGFTRADDSDVKADAERIGRALAERIEGVLLGDIDETPVPIPEEEEEGAEGRAPSEPPFPEEMALSLEDLPEGIEIEREGYVADDQAESSYEREFDLAFETIGGSEFVSLENDIDLFEDEFQASGLFAAFAALFTGENAVDFLGPAFSAGAGFEVGNVTAEDLGVSDVGDESFGVRAAFDTPLGRLDGIFVSARVGRAMGTLIITGLAGKVAAADVVDLLEKMVARMEAELATAR
jgi:hypothetical protein